MTVVTAGGGSMPHDDPRGSAEDLRPRMKTAWRTEGRDEFFLVLATEFVPLLLGDIRRRFRFDDEICQQCADKAVDVAIAYHNEDGGVIDDPFSYLMTVAYNEARRISGERRKFSFYEELTEADEEEEEGHGECGDHDDWEGSEFQGVDPQLLFEEFADVDLDPRNPWWAEVLEAGIARLPASPQKVIRHLLGEDFDFIKRDYMYNSQDALRDLGMSPAAFRKNKERAYSGLRVILPLVIQEVGLQVESRIFEAIFEQRSDPDD